MAEIAQVFHVPGPHDEEGENEQDQAPAPVIAAEAVGTEGLAEAAVQVQQPEVPAQKLQPPIRGEILVDELNPQISFDHAPQTCYSQTYDRGFLCRESYKAVLSLETTQEASSFPHLFSDWG